MLNKRISILKYGFHLSVSLILVYLIGYYLPEWKLLEYIWLIMIPILMVVFMVLSIKEYKIINLIEEISFFQAFKVSIFTGIMAGFVISGLVFCLTNWVVFDQITMYKLETINDQISYSEGVSEEEKAMLVDEIEMIFRPISLAFVVFVVKIFLVTICSVGVAYFMQDRTINYLED